MAYLTEEALRDVGFKQLGVGVQLSDKASFYGVEHQVIGDHVRVDDFCVVSGSVTLGRYVHLAVQTHLEGGTAGVTFGDFSGAAFACQIFAQSDDYSGEWLGGPLGPTEYRNVDQRPIKIGRYVMIGTMCAVLPGVTIAEGCAFSAMSLVNADTDEWGMYGGIPARRFKERSRGVVDLIEKTLQDEQDSNHRRPEPGGGML